MKLFANGEAPFWKRSVGELSSTVSLLVIAVFLIASAVLVIFRHILQKLGGRAKN